MPPRREISRYAPLPHAAPLLAQLPPRTPHVLDFLPPPLRGTAVTIHREVAPDAPAFAAAAAAEAAKRREAASSTRLAEFRVRMNGKDRTARRATEGLDSTLAALRDGLASDVFLAGDPAVTAAAWIGPGPATSPPAKRN